MCQEVRVSYYIYTHWIPTRIINTEKRKAFDNYYTNAFFVTFFISLFLNFACGKKKALYFYPQLTDLQQHIRIIKKERFATRATTTKTWENYRDLALV